MKRRVSAFAGINCAALALPLEGYLVIRRACRHRFAVRYYTQVKGIFPGIATPIFYNASGAKIYGAEAEANLFVTPQLSFSGSMAYLHGRFKSFPNALFFTPRTAPPFGLIQSTGDATGNETVGTPEWVASVSGGYKIPTSFGGIELSGRYAYNSGYYFDPQNGTGNTAFHIVITRETVQLRVATPTYRRRREPMVPRSAGRSNNSHKTRLVTLR